MNYQSLQGLSAKDLLPVFNKAFSLLSILNLFIGIVVDAMHKEHAAEEEAEAAKQAKAQRDTAATLEEVKALRAELAAFREGLAKREGA